MGKISGLEEVCQLPPKVCQIYRAVIQLLEEGMEVGDIRVSTVTERAGIGKGTAYEYFDSREEMVACAIMYQVKVTFAWLENLLEGKETFREQLSFLLREMEQERYRICFLRLLHMLTDCSEFNRMLQRKMDGEAFAPYLPRNVFGRILGRAVENGELRGDLPMDYMIHCLYAHLLIHIISGTGGCGQMAYGTTRSLVYQGILKELEEDKT